MIGILGGSAALCRLGFVDAHIRARYDAGLASECDRELGGENHLEASMFDAIDERLREQVARQVRALPDGAYGTVFSTSALPVSAPESQMLPVHLAAAPWAVWLPPTAAAHLFDATKLSALKRP